MKRDLMDGVTGLVTLFVIGTVLVLASGCADNLHQHKTVVRGNVAIAKEWKPGRRCKVLGKVKTPNVAVIIEKDCLKKGLTTVNMLTLNNAKGGRVAAKDAVRIITDILQFKPVLAALFYGKIKGKVFILAAVTRVKSMGTVASTD